MIFRLFSNLFFCFDFLWSPFLWRFFFFNRVNELIKTSIFNFEYEFGKSFISIYVVLFYQETFVQIFSGWKNMFFHKFQINWNKIKYFLALKFNSTPD